MVQKTAFLTFVQTSIPVDTPKRAEEIALAVTRSLSRLVADSAVRRHFITQLPGFLKSELREHPPDWLVMDREAWLQHVASTLDTHVPDASRAVHAVWAGLKAAVSPGQIAEFERHIPADVVAFLERA
jgi:uncharacterized protein (DUF2267 family)